MSRREDREGVPRSNLQGHINRDEWAKGYTNERGWFIRLTVRYRHQCLGRVRHHLYRLRVVGDLMKPWERADEIRYARINLAEARQCQKPRLP